MQPSYRRLIALLTHSRFARSAMLTVMVLAGILVPAGSLQGPVRAAGTGPITYAYDGAGRLSGVVDPSQANGGVYHYDAAGNITAIGQQSTGQVSLLSFGPVRGSAGTTVTIAGTGFSPTAGNDTVKFNGTTASIAAASATQLVVSVPTGATTGPVSVAVAGVGSASSTTPFTVGAPTGPAISGLSSNLAGVGATLNISGSGYDPAPGHDVVRINGTIAQVQAASATSITAVVPPNTASGRLSVTTPGGTTTGGDVFIPPAPYTPAQVGSTGRISGGQTQTVNATSGKVALFAFDGSQGQRVSLSLAHSTLGSASISILTPDNVVLSGPHGFGSGSTFVDAVTLPFNGTYTILLDPTTSTGSVSLTLNQFFDVRTSVAANNTTPLTVATTYPGQRAAVTFSGTAGSRVSLQLANSTINTYTVKILTRYNSILTSNTFGTGTSFLDAVTLPVTGTYTIVIAPHNTQVGSVALTLNEFQDIHSTIIASSSPPGTPANVSIATPGQNAYLTFNGTTGQRASLQLAGSTINAYSIQLRAPDNVTVAYNGFGVDAGFLDAVTLPATGTYTVIVDPAGTSTGNVSLTLFSFSDKTGQTLTPNGAAVTVTTTTPGQNAYVTFNGTGGQKASFDLTGSTFNAYYVTLSAPNGATVTSNGFGTGSGFLDAVTLPSSGTYTIALDPSQAATGSVTLALHQFSDSHLSITPNGPSMTATIAYPGQNAYLAFNGTAGDEAMLQLNSALNIYSVTITAPDGNTIASSGFGSGSNTIGPVALSLSGTYSILLNPSGNAAGSITASLTEQPIGAHPGRSAVGNRSEVRGASPTTEGEARLRATTHNDKSRIVSRMHAHQTGHRPFGALTGQVRGVSGAPLVHVRLNIGRRFTSTNVWGAFTLTHVAAGERVMIVDGAAGRAAQSPPGRRSGTTYGTFEIRVAVRAHHVTALPYVIWLPTIDTAHAVTIASPTRHPVVLTTPRIPGLRIIIPKGATVHDRTGKVVHRLGITPIPTERPPFPFPHGHPFPVYFTVQPGGAVITPGAVQVVYPNADHAPPGTRMPFWGYDPAKGGWWVYGYGTVTRDGRSVVPDRNVDFYEFTGAGAPSDKPAPPSGPPPMCSDGGGGGGGGGSGGGPAAPSSCPSGAGGGSGGDPVDLATGLYVQTNTDLTLPDVIPVSITRTYRQNDPYSRFFGKGASFTYGMFLYQVGSGYQHASLVMPDGGQITYNRTSPGTGHDDAVFGSTSSPGDYYKSRISWNSDRGGWDLRLKTGMVYAFTDFGGSGANAILQAVEDRNGNILRIIWNNSGEIVGLKSPNGRWLQLAYTGEVITQAQDDLGRTLSYGYDINANLTSVTDVKGGLTTYGYDASGRLQTITDPRKIVSLTLAYDAPGRVAQETLADGSTYKYAYTTNSAGQIVQTSVTDRRGYVRQISFNADGYVTGDTYALGTPQQEAFTFVRQAGSGLIQSATDPLGRRMTLSYDANGNVIALTRMAGTAQAQTYGYTYNPTFSRVTSFTDPLGHKTTLTYDASGNLVALADILTDRWTASYNAEGELTSVTDPLNHTVTFGYTFGDLTSGTDQLGRVNRRFVDAAGRARVITDALGNVGFENYDNLDHLTQVLDPLGNTTTTTYDPNENVQSITDPRGNTTYYAYTPMNQLCAVADPLAGLTAPPSTCPSTATPHTSVSIYDAGGNLARRIDRKGQVTTYQYDPLNRTTQVAYADGSTITYSYDLGNRIVQSVDSRSGTITRTYDGLDRLTSETDPVGTPTVSNCNGNTAAVSVCYTYDAANNRTGMMVSGQSAITYAYDAVNRLIGITQGTGTVSGCNGSSMAVSVCLTYNSANLQTALILPDGVSQRYSYDSADQQTGITYTSGSGSTSCNGYSVGTCLGYVNYGYDLDGRETTVSGPWARTGIPAVLGSATYNAVNELCWTASSPSSNGCGSAPSGATTYAYDANGNLTSDGSRTYTWSARDQLASIGGASAASFGYDAFGRRISSATGGTTTKYLLDGQNVVQELSGGAAVANLLTGPGLNQYYGFSTSAGQSSLLTDGLGSTVALAGSSGTVSTQYTYDPFGETTLSGAASANPIQFAGMQHDGTGLYFAHARYYSPGTARFISQDPMGCNTYKSNLYRYVADDPLNLFDPLGLVCELVRQSAHENTLAGEYALLAAGWGLAAAAVGTAAGSGAIAAGLGAVGVAVTAAGVAAAAPILGVLAAGAGVVSAWYWVSSAIDAEAALDTPGC